MNGISIPGSAADIPKKPETDSNEIMIIVQDKMFMLSIVDAISLAGTINAIVAGKMRNDNGC